jgi:lysostaphin
MRFVCSMVVCLALAACEIVSDEPARARRDSAGAAAGSASGATTGVASAGTIAGDSAAIDSLAAGMSSDTPSIPGMARGDSIASDSLIDATAVRLHPASPRAGEVLFALVPARGGDIGARPTCELDGERVPCAATAEGIVVTAPIPADADSGAHTLGVQGTGRRVERAVSLAPRRFPRELVFLDRDGWARVTNTRSIARDARAVREVLTKETPERLWSGAWRAPVPLDDATGFGAERFYFRASDSSRVVRIEPDARTRGSFAGDTSSAAFRDQPAWRHSGVDVPVRRGTRVVASAAGRVADVGDYTLMGRTVLIDHGLGVYSAYFHLDSALVREGETVAAGRAIGRVGSTGLATGPHLHYAVYLNGQEVDPLAWHAMPDWYARAER